MTSAIFLISHIIFGEATAIGRTIPSAMVFALLWSIAALAAGAGRRPPVLAIANGRGANLGPW